MNDNEKKGWLLSGYKIDPNYKKIGTKKAQDELASFSAQYSNPTQYGPTFRRPALVACAIDSLTDFFKKSKNYHFGKASTKLKNCPNELLKSKTSVLFNPEKQTLH
ncbi:MAG: hypothetical protein IKL48_02875 [Elusimicrobiaceae bacterium]|nr:hypothetical protein [Elusimicrobiaceae bacterium]